MLQQGEPGLVVAWRSGLSPSPCSFRIEIGGLGNCSSEEQPLLWAQAEGRKSPVLLQNLPGMVWHMPL